MRIESMILHQWYKITLEAGEAVVIRQEDARQLSVSAGDIDAPEPEHSGLHQSVHISQED